MGTPKKQPIGNATAIIEKFGGIRPMSAKVNVAVTTIQGWKKRDAIPATRKAIILEAAKEHNIDLSEFFSEAPSVDAEAPSQKDVKTNTDIKFDISIPERITETVADPAALSTVDNGRDQNAVASTSKEDAFVVPKRAPERKNFTELAVETERRAITKSSAIAALMVVIVIGVIVAMLWPDFKEFDARRDQIAMLEDDMSEVKASQSTFKGLMPENWSRQLDDLKSQMSQASAVASDAVETVQAVSRDFVKDNGLEERVVQLQSYVSEITGENGVYGLFVHLEVLDESNTGRDTLNDSVLELSDILGSLSGQDDSYINNAIDAARAKSAALQVTLGNVPKDELKAAAMLLALTQVRSALNRSDEAFDDDLGLLIGMVGDDNPGLHASLAKLAPHSKSGVLSANGLQKEFRAIAGDVVAASLRGEDVSFSEKASARLNEILQVEKNGELVSGTETQATINKASKMLALGNIDAALRFLNKQLNSKELAPLRPWINKAKISLAARKAQKAIEKAIDNNLGGGLLGGSQLFSEEK